MPNPAPTAFVARTILWIVLSSGFALWNLRRLAAIRAAGFRPSTWAYAQLALWCLALAFWLYTGWRDWTRRTR